MVQINITSNNVREDDGAVMIELLMSGQSSQPFKVVISAMDITATGTYIHIYVCIHSTNIYLCKLVQNSNDINVTIILYM